MNSLKTQIGGDHYKKYKVQPIEFFLENKVPYAIGNIAKYLCRYKDKNGLEDINKAIHYIQLMLDSPYTYDSSSYANTEGESLREFIKQFNDDLFLHSILYNLFTCKSKDDLQNLLPFIENLKFKYE